MKHWRMRSTLLSLILTASVLTSCGDQSSTNSTAESDAERTGTTQAVQSADDTGTAVSFWGTTSETTAQTTAAEAGYVPTGDKQYDDARQALDSYLQACVAGNRESLLFLSNLHTNYEIAESHAGPGVRFRNRLDEIVQNSLDYTSAKIGKGTAANDLMQEYNDSLAGLAKDLAGASGDPQKQAELQLTVDVRHPIDALYVFPVLCQKAGGQTVSEQFYVSCTDDVWLVDMSVIPLMRAEKRTAAMNLAALNARQFFIAVSNSLTELYSAGVDVKLADGLYYYRGADFGWGFLPEETVTQADIVTAMNIKSRMGFADSSECDQLAFAVNGGVCKAVALQRGSETDPVSGTESYYFGCYPNVLTENDLGAYFSIEDVLVHAMG